MPTAISVVERIMKNAPFDAPLLAEEMELAISHYRRDSGLRDKN